MRKSEPESHMFNLVFHQSERNSVSQEPQHHRGVKTDRRHKFQLLLVTLGPMTCEVTGQYKDCSPPLLSLCTPALPESLRGPKAVQPGFSSSDLLFPSNSSWRRVAASSSSHQGNLLATQALSSSKLRLGVQQENFNQPLSCTTQQKPARRFHRTSNGTAATSFFHFSRTVKHLGLMIY